MAQYSIERFQLGSKGSAGQTRGERYQNPSSQAFLDLELTGHATIVENNQDAQLIELLNEQQQMQKSDN